MNILKNLSLFLLSAGLGLGAVQAQQVTPAVEALNQLFAKEWQARIDRDPMMATRMGIMETADELLDVSPKAYQQWSSTSQGFLDQLAVIDKSRLDAESQINYAIFEQQLKRRISQIEFKSYELPFLSDSGFHSSIMRLPKSVPLKNAKDYENYLKRLAAIPAHFEQHKANMRSGLSRNYSMPLVVMDGFTEVIKAAYAGGWEKSAFWEPMDRMPKTISKKQQKKLQKQAKKVIREEVLPAFRSLTEFFETVYIPGTKRSLAAYDFPDGKRYYQAQIKHYTTLDLTPDQIHQIGLNEVARIRSEMEAVIAESGFKGTFAEFVLFLREDPQFYAKTAEDLIKEAAYISKKMDGQLPRFFTRLPRQPYGVEPVPAAIAPKYTTGRYVGAPLDSERPGLYWVNTYALDKRPLYVLEALTLHEAVPGHHLQNALNKELENLPEFRRFSYISAFGEGWGLYSERLGLEAGFYQDPYSNFGRLTYEMWRAARLVIDTGIHAKGWTREQSIKLLEENSALSTHNIRTEVDRYISWPGQALSYKLGEIKIRELRARAENSLGEKFDIRIFHDEILRHGSVPLDVLEQQIDNYIERIKAG